MTTPIDMQHLRIRRHAEVLNIESGANPLRLLEALDSGAAQSPGSDMSGWLDRSLTADPFRVNVFEFHEVDMIYTRVENDVAEMCMLEKTPRP
jgi:hypothetical protein